MALDIFHRAPGAANPPGVPPSCLLLDTAVPASYNPSMILLILSLLVIGAVTGFLALRD